ncbi:copper fist DNA binding domain-containing protein [Fennellomyces sp. T-0311]|nr:copper fist DNA binding domain-containing protein [Fennellomyces sp. T-0311]
MLLIVGKDGVERKYSCMTCIKGHRSSKCKHPQRQLYEIKPKGRPVSQCQNCRELRKQKRVHIKCSCKSRGTKDEM